MAAPKAGAVPAGALAHRLQTEESWGYDRRTIDYIQHAAATGLYEIRGMGAKRLVPHFDDLLFLGASLSRYPLEGYRERCSTKTILGTRFAKRPIELAMPITIAGMSFGSLSARVKEALGRAATEAGTSRGDASWTYLASGPFASREALGTYIAARCYEEQDQLPLLLAETETRITEIAAHRLPARANLCWR